MKLALLAALFILPATASAQPALQQQVEAKLAQSGLGTRFGLVVVAPDGRELVAINPDGRFLPASNTKMLTTAAVFATMSGLDAPDAVGGALVRLEGQGAKADVILEGHGDARLSSASDCVADCLAVLADAVAARTRRVRDVIGDDRAFADERWSPGMSWNNIPSSSGTAISALTLDDNEVALTVSPGAAGQPAQLASDGYYRIDNRAVTIASGEAKLEVTRMPASLDLLLTGTILAGSQPQKLQLGIDDPAFHAAWRFKAMLEARGVRVTGTVAARHLPPPLFMPESLRDGPAPSALPPGVAPLAQLKPPPLAEDLVRTNKESQNLHAELMIRRLGAERGEARIAGGIAAIAEMLDKAGVARTAWGLSDGSGMSSYNRVAPRGMVALLRWISAQPWGAAWKATLPIAGNDGTLKNRFKGSSLEGKLFAKTGTLNASSALSGWLTARSGRILTFSFFANDVPESVKINPAMDAALTLVAEAS
jgi:D-alanyl-D-alanine carboxypeptidase/D-alanyl-D-alanine-endopeptidase (penicillin-binding protein 4)